MCPQNELISFRKVVQIKYRSLVTVALLSVVLSSHTAARARQPPCDKAEQQLNNIASKIVLFRRLERRCPYALEELYGGSPDLILVDPWGQPYLYGGMPLYCEVYSSGPDRVPNTDDDMYPGVPWTSCPILHDDANTNLADSWGCQRR